MKDRVIMNSSNLQKTFPEVYEDFFTKNNFIISCPQVINRWNITHLDAIRTKIVQKLPTKMYMGANIRKDKEIHLQRYIQFSNSEKKFIIQDMEIEKGKELNNKMTDNIKEKLLEFGCDKWVDFMVLSENERGTGTTTATTEALLLSITIHILSGKLLPEQLDDCEKFMKSKEYKSIVTTTQELIGTITGVPKKDINSTVMFATAVHDRNLCIWFDNKQYVDTNFPKIFHIDNNICAQHINPNSEYALECSIINFWGFFSEFYNRETYVTLQKEYTNLYEKYNIEDKNNYPFLEVINFLYLNVLQAEKKSSMNPYDEAATKNLFDQINRLWLYQSAAEKYLNIYMDIERIFKKNITFEDEEIWIIPISSCKPGGTFKCFTKKIKSRETLQKMIEELRENGYPTAHMQWASREDGLGKDHIHIEQYLDEWCVSTYAKDNDSLFENNLGKKTLGKHRELLKQPEDNMIFDCIDGKIYINNELTTHKEILTQSGTVEIMKMVFEHMGKYVNNSKLPVSSYTKNKNEMVGKIIWPLQELVKKRFGEKLDLECTGSIVDFDLKLTPNKINIWLLKKITH